MTKEHAEIAIKEARKMGFSVSDELENVGGEYRVNVMVPMGAVPQKVSFGDYGSMMCMLEASIVHDEAEKALAREIKGEL